MDGKAKLLWHWMAIVYVWHVRGDVDDETAFVALSRLKQFVDYSLGVIDGSVGTVRNPDKE